MKLAALTSSVLILLILVAGCGGSSGESSASEQQLTQAAFVKQTNEICRRGLAKRTKEVSAAFAERQKNGQSLNDNKAFTAVLLNTSLPVLEEMASELAQVGTPSTKGELAAAMVGAFQKGTKQIKTEPQEVLNGADPFAEVRKQARLLKIKNCTLVF